MLIEMHCHTAEHSSCSSVCAVELVQQVYAKRLQGLVLTDHHYLWPNADLAELRREAGIPDDFVVLSGQETNVPDFGDVLIYGAPVTIPRGSSIDDIRREYPDLAIVWAHPYREGRKPAQHLLCSTLLDGVEIFNSNHTVRGNSRGLQDWRRYRFTATGGTDTHGATYAGIYPTLFDFSVRTVEELASAIRSGNCRPFLKEIHHREAREVTEVTMGTGESDKARNCVIIRTPADQTAWSKAERAFRIMTAISDHGFDHGTFRVPRGIDKNAESMTLIEQGVTGESLFEKILSSTAEDAGKHFRLSARWLARLHGLRLQVTTPEEFFREEARRLHKELAIFRQINHPYSGKAAEIVTAVQRAEHGLMLRGKDSFVQGHGDYHPKNLIIGQDSRHDPPNAYLAAIDFDRSQVMPPAFDVGWFLTQFRNQFAAHMHVISNCKDEDFLEAYAIEAGEDLQPDFLRQVELFRARTNISIASFMIEMGLGESGELWRMLVEAERALTNLS